MIYMICSCQPGDREDITSSTGISLDSLRQDFLDPPDETRPWVYWINMDGHFNMEGITADLESIKEAGLGGVLFMEVDLGIPRGDVSYMTPEWQDHMRHAMQECKRLGLEFSLIAGPGWTGSGGPWISSEQSMQHLLTCSVNVKGPARFDQMLPVPELQISRFHLNQTPETLEQINNWLEDVALFAFPACDPTIKDIAEKALYKRDPYTSMVGVKPYLLSEADYPSPKPGKTIDPQKVIDLTGKLDQEGRLKWDVPPGEWTLLRMCSRSTGAISRPAPLAGVGLESNKFEKAPLDHHFDTYVGKLMEINGIEDQTTIPKTGWNTLQFESWEMSSQNWSKLFRDEFRKRRGYDLWTYLPVMSGRVVNTPELSERFLWDLRQTSQDLIIENHAQHLLKRAHEHGFQLHIEPHDMNPTTDMLLASVGDVPMAEFWTNHFNSAFSCHQASSTGHIYNKPVVAAEAFTSYMTCWTRYPYMMKDQGDWAFTTGINRFVFVQFTHKPWQETKPGMAFGPHGIYWDRNQTFWPLVNGYHDYISRCSYLLRQGDFMADICYLLPEGAPNVFVPPPSACKGDKWTPDRKGYNFDGCPPDALLKMAEVVNGKIEFPGGASYHLLVLPDMATMTPELLRKIGQLVSEGATIVGSPPVRSPSLSGFPACDQEIEELVRQIWGGSEVPQAPEKRDYGKGAIWWGGPLSESDVANYDRDPSKEMEAEELNSDYPEGLFGHDGTRPGTPYPEYEATADILREMDVPEDFTAAEELRYTHLTRPDMDIYFVGNRTEEYVKSECTFRVSKGSPRLWDPVTGEVRELPEYDQDRQITRIPLEFEAFQSYFVVFSGKKSLKDQGTARENFPQHTSLMELGGPWNVSFDPQWGGPEEVVFEQLTDWSASEDPGIRYYSGIASYQKDFKIGPDQLPDESDHKKIYLCLGRVNDLARVILNGKDVGTVWTAPWHVEVSETIQPGENHLEVRVANRWPNRLIGDEFMPDDGVSNGQFPEWLVGDDERTSGRYTYTTLKCYTKESSLLPSGLLGPVVIEITK